MSDKPVPPPLDRVATDVDFTKFRYWLWTPSDVVIESFDASVDGCRPFGFFHGQRVKHTKGSYADGVSTVIGVRDGRLFYDPDGQCVGAVSASNPAPHSKEDVLGAFGWEVVGETYVEEAHPAGSPKKVPHKERAASASPPTPESSSPKN